ncbi:hypothetical protein [Kitasatospora phosalacinea]|uniref:Uncharacterized protein n=1 Tax=Kitasatospora phosalacinea TaxID=2065 RepID=A0ABW6GRR9_9ACTN
MTDVLIILAAIVLLVLIGVVAEWRARCRVRAAQAHDITPDAVRYISTPREDRP